jgi:hypothetical protein
MSIVNTYSKADVMQWLLGAFAVNQRVGDELNFDCPSCGHESCYFNVRKQQGYCHSASCHAKFDMRAMTDLIGYPPELAGYVPGMEKKEKVIGPVELPKGAELILQSHEDVQALALRGVEWSMIQKFHLHRNETHIIVPIYDEGELVQYNSRRINRNVTKDKWFSAIQSNVLRYKYASGRPITNFFLGWEECKLWERIVLVENTFVSMWLRDLGVTTNFGSYLSDTQIDKLVHSNIKHITFLWDGPDAFGRGAADPQKAQKKLKKAGIPSVIKHIRGQPDDYDKDTIKEILDESTDR